MESGESATVYKRVIVYIAVGARLFLVLAASPILDHGLHLS